MRLAPEWLKDAEVVRLVEACAAGRVAIRFVGGAVRDTLLMREVGDIDAATPVPAEQVMAALRAQGLKVIPTGIAHGTVTVVVGERRFEITTLRRDVETDGRHAKIAPTDSWEEDAARRDFTMNALYLSPEGELFDYHDGAEDALHGRVRFIGDAGMRIAEDGLRMLRFFRFFATHGEPPADQAALLACEEKRGMIAVLSGERIAAEMKKLLGAAQPIPALRLMAQAGVAQEVFGCDIELPTLLRLTMLEHTTGTRVSIWARCAALLGKEVRGEREAPPSTGGRMGGGLPVHPSGDGASQPPPQPSPCGGGSTGIGAMGGSVPVAGAPSPQPSPARGEGVIERWRLSRAEAKHLRELLRVEPLHAVHPKHHHTRVMRVHGAAFYRDLLLLSAAADVAWDIAPWIALSQEFVAPEFPVGGEDLKRLGVKAGKEMGAMLSHLETMWEESGYTLSKEALLEKVRG